MNGQDSRPSVRTSAGNESAREQAVKGAEKPSAAGRQTGAPACMECGKPLERDEIAIYRKLVNRGATRFSCIPCLARHFRVSEELIRQKIVECRQRGCTLFL